ncbi:unnamed protein product [Ixodes pacificus]
MFVFLYYERSYATENRALHLWHVRSLLPLHLIIHRSPKTAAEQPFKEIAAATRHSLSKPINERQIKKGQVSAAVHSSQMATRTLKADSHTCDCLRLNALKPLRTLLR